VPGFRLKAVRFGYEPPIILGVPHGSDARVRSSLRVVADSALDAVTTFTSSAIGSPKIELKKHRALMHKTRG